MIGFLALPSHLRHWAYGVRQLLDSKGNIVLMPNCTRKRDKKDLYSLYQKHCSDSGETLLPRADFKYATEVIAGRDEEMLDALDSVDIKCGTDNFTAMKQFIDLITGNDVVTKENIISEIKAVQLFMNTGLRNHLMELSTVACHSFEYLFGAPPNNICRTHHTQRCSECDSILLLPDKIELAVQNVPDSRLEIIHESRQSLSTYVREKLVKNLNTYYKHIIRAEHEKSTLDKVLENMELCDCVIVTDWKMKLLMMLYRESMVEFFAKRGIPWLGAMIIRKLTETEVSDAVARTKKVEFHSNYHVQFYDGLCDDSKENGFAAISHLEGVMSKYKSESKNAHVTKCSILSDGAGCFAGSEFCIGLSKIGDWTGIKVTNHFISEAGCGKTSLDGHFAYARSHLIRTVATGEGTLDIFDAESAAIALAQRGGIQSSTAACVKVDRAMEFSCKKIEKARTYMHRQYLYDDEYKQIDSIILRPQSFRGDGIVMSRSDIMNKIGVVNGIQMELPFLGTGVDYRVFEPDTTVRKKNTEPLIKIGVDDKARFVEIRGKRKEKKAAKEKIISVQLEEKIAEQRERSTAYFCPTKDCTAVFCYEVNLLKHVKNEVHWYGKSHTHQLKYTINRRNKEGVITNTVPIKRVNQAIVADNILQFAAAQLADVCGNGVGTKKHVGTLTSNDDDTGKGKVIAAGYAMKAPAAKNCYKKKSKKLGFIVWVHGLGEKKVSGNGAVKISPEQAERLMWIVGTNEGAAQYPNEEYMNTDDGKKRFKLIELQDSYQLKGYLGKTRAVLVSMYDRAVKKEEIEDAKRVMKGQQAMEDVVYNYFEDDDENAEDNNDAE